MSQPNGDYSFTVSGDWSGTVTPSHPCYTFSPTDLSYSNVITDQVSQDYTPTAIPASGCTDINVKIAGASQGTFSIATQGTLTQSPFPGINDGPVEMDSTVPIIGAQRVIYKVGGVPASFSEMMGLPAAQLDTIYWLPWYNNKDLNTQLRIANVAATDATIHVTIGGVEMTGSPYTLTPGASRRLSYAGIDKGPVKIESDVDIVAAERVIYKVNNVNTSFSEMMALQDSKLDTIYWLPRYNNVSLDTQLRIANVGATDATVHVIIDGAEVTGSPFTVGAGKSVRKSFPGINKGLVKIESDIPVVAAQRVIYKVNGIGTSFSEMMGLPAGQLDTAYWLPWYNNVELDTHLRFGVP